ncbi:MAG: hypothetical protein ABIO70_13910 [Pseudomonadota bacterium]
MSGALLRSGARWGAALFAALVLAAPLSPPVEAATNAQYDQARQQEERALAEGRDVALLVAVTSFQPGWPPLGYTAHDVVRMARALLSPAGGAFDEVLIVAEQAAVEDAMRTLGVEEGGAEWVRILASRCPVEATAAGIREAFGLLAGEPFGRDGTAVVYISAHGGRIGPRKFLVAADTPKYESDAPVSRADDGRFGIPLDDLQQLFRRVQAPHRLIVKAFCNSELYESHGRKGDQSTYDPWYVAGVDSEISAGPTVYEDPELNDRYTWFFTQAILKQGAWSAAFDLDGDGAVSDIEAHNYVLDRFAQDPVLAAQRPSISHTQVTRNVLLLTPPERSAIRAVVSALSSAEGLLLDVVFQRVGAAPATQVGKGVAKGGGGPPGEPAGEAIEPDDVVGQGLWVQEPGRYRVIVTDKESGRIAYRGPVRVEAGQHLVVERLTTRSEPLALRLGVGATTWGGEALTERVMGVGPSLSVVAARPLRGRERTSWVLDLGLDATLSSGTEPIFDADYRATTTGLSVNLAVRSLWRFRMGDLSLGPLVGYGWYYRAYEQPKRHDLVGVRSYSLLAPYAGGRALLELTPGLRWAWGAGVDAWVYSLELDGDVRPRGVLVPWVSAGVRL